ncbi:MAG: energy transducer TonB [Tidjanibacter sp.]|nr:energy transducer TonB [Tidjanibacter sp.]
MEHKSQTDTPKRPRLALPFVRRKVDPAMWAYEHRLSILVTVAAYVIFGVAFVAADVVVSRRASQSEILLDLTNLEELQKELERAQELNRLLNERYEDAETSNRISNENALDDNLADHRTDARSIYEEAERVQQSVRDNAADYALGLKREQELLDQHYEGENIKNEFVRGSVTVSYSLSEPVRHAIRMPVPAYMCEGGGEVVVEITVNTSGEVVDCKVVDKVSTKNNCLREAALSKAGVSLFNADPSAPARQKGRISYMFIAQ